MQTRPDSIRPARRISPELAAELYCGQISGIAKDVASDLEGIFGVGVEPPAPPSDRPSHVQVVIPRPAAQAPRRLALFVGMAVVVFLGLAGATLWAERGSSALSGLRTGAGPAPVVAHVSAPPTETAAPPDIMTASAPVAPAVASPTPAARPSPAVRPALAGSRAVRISRPQSPGRLAASASCGRSERCGYASVLAADRELRRAYAGAIRAGVAPRVLVDVRDRWASLREEGAGRPRQLVGDYNDLASDLGEAAKEARLNRRADGRETARWQGDSDRSWR